MALCFVMIRVQMLFAFSKSITSFGCRKMKQKIDLGFVGFEWHCFLSFPGNQTEDGVFIYDSNAHALMFLPFGVINSCAPVCVPRKTEENNGSVLGLWILTFEWVHLRTFSREPNKADITQDVLFWCFLYPT